MPPRQKETITVSSSSYIPSVGSFVHVLTSSGSKFKSSEILETHETGIVIRTDLNGPTSAEISFIPWSAIVGVGLIGKR